MSADDMPSTEIVSRVRTTSAGHQAWIERDGLGRLWLRCECGTYTRQVAMAPALHSLVHHVCPDGGTDTLTCPHCGNDKGWRDATQRANGTQTAICGCCGRRVTSRGGVQMGHVNGDMNQER